MYLTKLDCLLEEVNSIGEFRILEVSDKSLISTFCTDQTFVRHTVCHILHASVEEVSVEHNLCYIKRYNSIERL